MDREAEEKYKESLNENVKDMILTFRRITMTNGFTYNVTNEFAYFLNLQMNRNQEIIFVDHRYDVDNQSILTSREISENRYVDCTNYISKYNVLIVLNKIASVEEVEVVVRSKNK